MKAPRRPRPARLVLVALLALAGSAFAGQRAARLVVDAKIEGQDRLVKGPLGETSSGTLSETFRLTAILQSDGKLENSNRNEGRMAAASGPSGGAASRQAADARHREIREALAACKGEVQCVGRVSNRYFGGGAPAAARAGEGSGEPRFLAYRGSQDCGADLHVRVQDAREGVLEDLGVSVPFTEKTTADHRASAGDKLQLCGGLNDLVLDTRAKTIFVTLGDPPVTGQVVREQRTPPFHTDRSASLRLQKDAMAWIRQQLQGAPRQGTARAAVPVTHEPRHSGSRTGTVNVELSWKFEDL